MAELPRVATELPAKQPESWVYMVRCADGSLYTGWTENLYARMEAHRTGKGSKCVRGKGFEKLAWAERQPVPGRGLGQKREAQVKALPKEQKEAMAAQWAERMRPRLTMARPADGPQVLALYRWYVLNSTATFNWVPDTEENYIKMVRATLKKAPFLLARDGDDNLLGYACAHPWRAWDAYAWDMETTIYCAPEARGRGVGPMLYNALLALLLIAMTLPARKKRSSSFAIQHNENGTVRISLKALDALVQKCLNQHAELKVVTSSLFSDEESIRVDVHITLQSDISMPLAISALQKQIKKYL